MRNMVFGVFSSSGKRMRNPNSDVNVSNGRSRLVLALFCTFALVLLLPCAARPQVTTAAVRGTVTDEQGAALAGADVTIASTDSGLARSTKSGADGEYNFPDLPLGNYKIGATHAGFKAQTLTGIVLHVGDSLVINVGLKVGAISESVTVEASPIAVETTSGELTGLIEGSQVQELPLNGRNFMQLVTLMPGVAAAEAFSTREKGIKGASDLSVSGSPSNGNQWLVDGANNNDTGSQRTILIYPSTESIQEFKIERNSYGAEFGLMSGATINLVTKSGTNQFHGSVFYSGRNDKLDAYDPLLKDGCPTPLSSATCTKNKLRENDFGYTIGGPIKKDKIFFFWDEEWNKKIEGLVRTSHVPTMAERKGDFSATVACPGGSPGKSNNAGFPVNGLNDPNPGDPGGPFGMAPNSFGTMVPAIIPSTRSTSQGLLLMTQYPAPTISDPCVNLNWTKSLNTPSPWREENVRGDVNLTKTLTLMLKFTNNAWTLGPPSAGFGWGDNPLGVIDESWDQPSRIAAAKLSKTIGAGAVNDFQFSYSANRININPTNLALEQQINDAIPWFFPTSGKRYGDKGPSAWFSGWGNAHLPSVWTIAPWHNAQDLYTWQDDFSMVKGAHTLKFGAVYSRNSKNEQTPNQEFGGIFGSTGFQGVGAAKTGFDVADMELKGMAINMGEASNITINDIRWQNTEFYAADNFRVTSRLTLNYGLRYSLLPNPYFADDLYTSFNPAAYNPALGNATCNGLLYSPGLKANPCPAGTGGTPGPNRALWNNNNHMIAPRVGIAWDPTGQGKWAIRAGGGQFFNRDRLFALQIGGTNPPFVGNFADPNGRFLDSLNVPTQSGSAFSTGLGNASIGAETTNQMPNSWQYNVSVQHELWKDTRLEVGYVANRNIHWEIRSDVNAVAPANRVNYFQDQACSSSNNLCGTGVGAGTARTALRPFGGMRGDNSLTYYTHSGQSSYNSLQTLFQTRFQRNSQLQLAYTWSKLISDTQLIDSPNNNLDFYNPRANRGPDQLNRPQIVSLNWIYNLPTLQNQSNYLRTAFGSWELSSIYSYATGPSMTGTISGTPIGDISATGSGGNEVPMRVAGQGCRANTGDARQWFNPNMFTLNGMQIGQKGSEGFGICSGPGNNVVDFSFRKNFKLTEKVHMQFTMDFFNLFNHPQYLASSIGGNGEFNVNFNGPGSQTTKDPVTGDQIGIGNPSNALYLDSAGTPVIVPAGVDATTTKITGCGASHLASATGTAPQTWCASSIVNTTVGNNFGIITQSRENGWRQVQYGLVFRF
jgi:Carboxypeptidase regulatory-like domain